MAIGGQAGASPAEAALLARLDVVTSIIGGWVWETDAEHRFVYMSPSVARFAGKSPEWHYGRTRQELGNTNLQTADGGSWQAQLEAREPFGPVDFVRYQDGKTLHMRTIGHPQFDAEGRFTGYIGVAFEVAGANEPEVAERRRAPRRRIVRAAEITTPSGDEIMCVLVDISTTGARLRVPPDVIIPDRFRLSVAALSLGKACRLRWRRANEVGVEFDD
jgi:hypothetical protein